MFKIIKVTLAFVSNIVLCAVIGVWSFIVR